jgi:hypothetical protein
MSNDGKRTAIGAGLPEGPGMSDSEFLAMMEQYTKAQDEFFTAASTSASSSPGGGSGSANDPHAKEKAAAAAAAAAATAHLPRPKKRKSRWGSDDTKTRVPGMPTTLPKGLTADQEKQYIYQWEIEEVTRKLRSDEMGIPKNPEDRSPSPEPIYNSQGQRQNTREYRTKRKLEEQRHALVNKMMQINSSYRPPSDYRRVPRSGRPC